MGEMIDGVYFTEDAPLTASDGSFQRARSTLRDWISPGQDPAELHLFVAWNCPWAHRALLARNFKGLTDITVSIAAPRRTDQGWVFDDAAGFGDPLFGSSAVHEIYARHPDPYTGRITVPVLWDKLHRRIISNESADIVRMLNDAYPDLGPNLAPEALLPRIDEWNDLIYRTVNNGVYRAGFASTQAAYAAAATEVFETLDRIDVHLAYSRYLCGDAFSEADLRLFPTLARFDVAYHYAFKCNLKKISDYAHLWPYAREIYQMPGVAGTVHPDIYKAGYFSPSEKRNPLGIVPIGPVVDWSAPHGRGS